MSVLVVYDGWEQLALFAGVALVIVCPPLARAWCSGECVWLVSGCSGGEGAQLVGSFLDDAAGGLGHFVPYPGQVAQRL